jgi:hypothetical protein
LTLAQRSTELPADVALDTYREHDLEKRAELPQHREPTPQESIISNPLTPSKVELIRQDEKAPIEYALKGFKKLNREKAVTCKDNSVEAPQNYSPVSGSRALL